MITALDLARKAAYVMNAIADELQLGNLGEKYQGDRPTDWAIHDRYTIMCLKHGRRVAELYFEEDDTVTVYIDDVYLMIRSEHIRSFNPEAFQIEVKDIPDYKGDTPPDLVIEWKIPPNAPIYQGERAYIPTSTHKRQIRVKSSLH